MQRLSLVVRVFAQRLPTLFGKQAFVVFGTFLGRRAFVGMFVVVSHTFDAVLEIMHEVSWFPSISA